jgi:type 1 glutamine amidotransferase
MNKPFTALCTLFALIALLSGTLAQQVAAEDSPQPKPLKVLLVTGGCCHDYDKQKVILSEGITQRINAEVTVVHDKGEGTKGTKHFVGIYKQPEWWKGYDVVIHDECYADVKDKDFVDGILAAHKAGVPAVNLHCALHCYRVNFDTYKDWFQMTGVDTRGHGPQLPITIHFTTPHPITKGMSDWTTIKEELYDILEVFPNVTPLATGHNGKQKDQLVIWTNTFGPSNTRVFSTSLGHNNETVADDRYLTLVTRVLLWTVNKLDDQGNIAPGYGK